MEQSTSEHTSRQVIQIRTLDGKTTKIEVGTNWTVKQLKEEFGKWKGTGFDKVNLHYKAKRLNDQDPLSKYNIEPDGFVQANIRSAGGYELNKFNENSDV